MVDDGLIVWENRAFLAPQNNFSFPTGNFVSFVAGGDSGKLSSSTDGVTWTLRTSNLGPVSTVNAIAYGAGLFVAVTGDGTGSTSPDGITWTLQANIAVASGAAALRDIVFANSLFVAVGGTNVIITSPDGINWTSRTSAITSTLAGIAFGAGVFCITGTGGPGQTSSNGTAWTSHANGMPAGGSIGFRGMNRSAIASLFIVRGVDGCGNPAMQTSPDGVTWTTRTPGLSSGTPGETADLGTTIYGVYQSPDLDKSTNGTSWSAGATNILGSSKAVNSITSGNNILAAAGQTGFLSTSPDGTTWTARTSGFGTDRIVVVFGA